MIIEIHFTACKELSVELCITRSVLSANEALQITEDWCALHGFSLQKINFVNRFDDSGLNFLECIRYAINQLPHKTHL